MDLWRDCQTEEILFFCQKQM